MLVCIVCFCLLYVLPLLILFEDICFMGIWLIVGYFVVSLFDCVCLGLLHACRFWFVICVYL